MKPFKLKIGNAVVYILLLCLAILAMYSMHRCSMSADKEALPSSSGGDTIDVAIEYSPLSFYTYNDTLGGFNYDLLKLLAEKHGLVLKFHPVVSLSNALKHIDKNTYDILAAELPVTSDYKDRYSLLEPVLLDKRVLVQLKDSVTGDVRIKSQLDLANDSVWIVDGSSVKGRIENLGREIGDTIYIKSDPEYGSEYLFLMTALGEIKQAVISERVAKAMADEYPQVDVSTGISFNQFQSWVASNRRPELKDSLNRWIADIKLTPEYKELERRYLNE